MLKFGFIGLNNVSEALCINLLRRVNSMAFVNDNSIARVEYVGNHGGVPCEIETDVVDRADIIVISRNNFVDLQATIYTIMGNLTSQKIVLDLSVISPTESLEIAAMLKPTGAEYADLAILNGLKEIEKVEGTILYGGSSTLFLKIQEYLKFMAGNAIKVGDATAALSMKVCYNILFAQIQNGVNEMLLYASKSGLYVDDIITSLQSSPAQNAFVQENGRNIASGNYSSKIIIKDVHKQLQFAHDFTFYNKIPMKGLELTVKLYESALDRKLESHGITEIFTIVERGSHS